jgi:hypothetical protein
MHRCARLEALGQRHPKTACYICCTAECAEAAKELEEEGGQSAASAHAVTSSILAATSNVEPRAASAENSASDEDEVGFGRTTSYHIHLESVPLF